MQIMSHCSTRPDLVKSGLGGSSVPVTSTETSSITDHIKTSEHSRPSLLDQGLSGSPKYNSRRHRVGQDLERLRKNRRFIDGLLKRIGKGMGMELYLNGQGISYFPFQKFMVVIEVPEDNPSVCLIYTMVCRLGKGNNQAEILKLAMQLNYMQTGTRGATLGLDGNEINLCFSTPINALTFYDFNKILSDFTQTATNINQVLETTKPK